MEIQQLNHVKLIGIIGASRITTVGDKKLIRFSVATNIMYRSADGMAVIETTWNSVMAFEGPNICNLDQIQKSAKVELTGRLRSQRYTRSDGTEACSLEILASEITILPADTTLTMQQ